MFLFCHYYDESAGLFETIMPNFFDQPRVRRQSPGWSTPLGAFSNPLLQVAH